MPRKERGPLAARVDDPANQPEVLAVLAAVDADWSLIKERLWLDQWRTTWLKAIESVENAPPGSGDWRSAVELGVRLLAQLEELRCHKGPKDDLLVPVTGGPQKDPVVWKRRIAVQFLKTGEYEGPNEHHLPPPDPLWTIAELQALAERARWSDVVRDIGREEVAFAFPGPLLVLPSGKERWTLIRSLLLGPGDASTEEGARVRAYVLLETARELTRPEVIMAAIRTGAAGSVAKRIWTTIQELLPMFQRLSRKPR